MNWKSCTSPNGLHDFPHYSIPCTRCGLYQNELWGKQENMFEEVAEKKSVKNIYSSLQATAYEIATMFGEKDKVGRYIGAVKRVGESKARMIAADVLEEKEKLNNPAAVFFYKCKGT